MRQLARIPARGWLLHRGGFLLILTAMLLVSVTLVSAQTGGGYNLSWWTVDGGGATFGEGSGYALGGTIGQPDAGVLEGGGYTLVGGFWGGGAAAEPGPDNFIYLPVVVRNFP
jgi:hypothetical protein